MARNPKWTRGEVILALELYFRVSPLHTSEKHPDIVSLSNLLNTLPKNSSMEANFRNPNGVYMKLCNFLTFDTSYSGVGLKAGSKLDKEIWEEFSEDREGLIRAAEQIREDAKRLKAYSWTIHDSDVAVKVLDKSAFLHHGTGIPVGIRPFFIDRPIAPGEKRNLVLIHGGKQYSAHIEMDHQDNSRSRLFWGADFAKTLKDVFPYHYQQYLSGELDNSSGLLMRFEREDGFSAFRIIFSGRISDETLQDDILSDEIEERGPVTEGAAKEYFGKRYERDAANRKRAIEIHGLSCNVCGFNFEEVYGERGSNYIEVHHVKPISSFEGKAQIVNPKTDLTTVCSNCHRMIHRRSDDILSLKKLKSIYQSQ